MKTSLFIAAFALCLTASCTAKDIKTVVLKTSPEMHCENCENKIKNNIRFEKGIKEIETNLEEKTVTIKYDADKTNVDAIIEGFAKINYTATVAGSETSAAPSQSSSCCGSSSCSCGSGKPCGSSCGDEKKEKKDDGKDVVYFKAVQMNCGGCANKVKTALEAAEGVTAATVDLDTKSVKVEYDAAVTNVDKLKEAFAGIQYASQLYYPEDSNVAYVSFKAEQMKCNGCANKVKTNMTAEAGVKDVTVCLETKAVSIAYDSNVTSVAQLVEGFKKFDYTVEQCYN